MKQIYYFILLALLCASSISTSAQTVIWKEDFSSYADGTNNLNQSSEKWWTDAHDSDDGGINNDGTNYWGVENGEFKVNDIEGASCGTGTGGDNENFWYSEQIDVSGYPNFSVSIKGRAQGDMECADEYSTVGEICQSADMLEASYQLDGGAWVPFFSMCGANSGDIENKCVQINNATKLRIRVQAGTKANSETYYFDDIIVTTTPAINLSGDIIIGETGTASISSTGGTWSSSNTAIATVDQTGKITGKAIGTATIYYTLAGGCDVSKEVNIINCTAPTIQVTDGNRCGSGTVTLKATPSSGTVNWYTSATSTTSIGSGNSFTTSTLSASTTYYAAATAGSCSSAKTAVNAVIHTIPTISGVSTLYESESTLYKANVTAATSTPWVSANSNIASIDDSGKLTAKAVGSTSITYESIDGCSNSSNVTVIAPSASISYSNSSLCNNVNSQTVSLTGNGQYSGGNYSSSTGLSIDTHTGAINASQSTVGNYVVIYAFPYSGGTLSASTSVQILASPVFSNVVASCRTLQSIYDITADLNQGALSSDNGTVTNTGNSWTISNIDASLNTTLSATSNGCTSTYIVTHPTCFTCPSMSAPISSGDTSFCEGTTIPTISAQVNTDEIVNWYDAETGGNLLLANSQTYTPNSAGTFYAEAENTNTSCLSTRTAVHIEEINIPIITDITDATICDENSGELTATASAGTIYWYTQENDINYIATGNTFTTPILSESRIYYAEAINGSCTSNERKMLTANVYSSPYFTNFEIIDRNTLYLHVDGGSSPYAYELNKNETGELLLNSLTLELNSGNYLIKINDKNLCFVDTIFTIDEKPKLKPEQVFTPNGDGINDYWDVENIQFFPKTEVFIYNRFGKEIKAYKASAFEPWDGYYLNNPVSSEDYWYIINVRETGDRLTGHFTLKR